MAAEARAAAGQTEEPSDEPVTFVEVTAAAAKTEPPIPPPAFEVVLASGAVVRVPAHFDSPTLRRLLDVMTTR